MAGPPPFLSGGYRGAGLVLGWNSIEGSGGFAWSCHFDTHNDLRLAVDPLSGGLLDTIYAESRESVRLESDNFSRELSNEAELETRKSALW
jgi:hypothetical protein